MAMRKLLIALIALVALFVAVDRIAVVVAQNQISDRIAAAYGLPDKPDVTIAGFPFLTQVVQGDYGRVDVSVGTVPADGATLHQLQAHFRDVHASLSQILGNSGSSTITADRAAGHAVVPFAAVDQRLPGGLKVRPDGKDLTVMGTLEYRGVRIRLNATLALNATSSGISVTPVHITDPGLGLLPGSLLSRLGFVLPLSTLPLHLHLTSVLVTPGGLQVGAAASHVYFTRAQ
jgi:LmeA-like phospholipid-binding